MKYLFSLLAVIALAVPVMATTLQDASPVRVLVITDAAGVVTVVQPRALDYQFELARLQTDIAKDDSATDGKSILRKIFPKKCHKRG